MKQKTLLTKMEKVVKTTLKAYFDDFYYYDINRIKEIDEQNCEHTFVWFARRHGTYLIELLNEESVDDCASILETFTEAKAYFIALKKGEWGMSAIKKDVIQNIRKRLEEIEKRKEIKNVRFF